MILVHEFEWEAAHNLIFYNGDVEPLHGHTYRMVVRIKGHPDEEDMVFDFVELERIVKEKIVDPFDHSYLNDFIQQPTAENIARYVWRELEPALRRPNAALYQVEIWETRKAGVIYDGTD